MRLVPQINTISISGSNIVDPISSTIDLSDIDRLSVQAVVTDSATDIDTFRDGALASGTVTVTDYTAATGTVVTVAGHALTEGVEWNAATSNNVTADSLAAAIDALSEVQAANPAAAIITIKAATIGTAGNAITTTKTGNGITVQQAVLSGGLASDVTGSPTYEIALLEHGYETGLKVNYDVITGTTIANLVTNTDYWVIKIDDDTIALADSEAHAIAGTKIHIADANDAVGGGSYTLTPQAMDTDVTLESSNDNVTFVALSGSPHNYTSNTVALYQFAKPTFKYLKVTVEPNDGQITVTVTLFGKSLA